MRRYTYKLGHKLFNGTYIWSQTYRFKSSPYPGQNSLQRVAIFGDMGKVLTLFQNLLITKPLFVVTYFNRHILHIHLLKFSFKLKSDLIYILSFLNMHYHLQDEADGSNEYNNFQRGSLNTTSQLIKDLKNIDIIFHIGDICYANGYLSQWDQFTSQVEPIASTVPYMIAR